MKKSYKIEVDCANCAQKMEDAANTICRRGKCYRQLYDPEDEGGVLWKVQTPTTPW